MSLYGFDAEFYAAAVTLWALNDAWRANARADAAENAAARRFAWKRRLLRWLRWALEPLADR